MIKEHQEITMKGKVKLIPYQNPQLLNTLIKGLVQIRKVVIPRDLLMMKFLRKLLPLINYLIGQKKVIFLNGL